MKQHPVWQTGQRVVMRHMGDACLGLALCRHIHDRDKLRGPVAKHGLAPICEDVDFRPIRLDMLPKWLGLPSAPGLFRIACSIASLSFCGTMSSKVNFKNDSLS